jgi:hypothetical protein
MGRFTTLIAAMALVVGACSAAASPAATPAAPTATATAPVTLAPTAAATPAALQVKVTFDGKQCTYVGPAAVPGGSGNLAPTSGDSVLEFALENTAAALKGSSGAALVVLPVAPGTTWAQILRDAAGRAGNDIPEWALYYSMGAISSMTPDSAAAGDTLRVTMRYGAYFVGCATSPTETNKMYPAILLQVMKG